MRVSTVTDVLAKTYGDAEALRRLAEIGYDAVDFSLFNYPQDQGLLTAPLEQFRAYFQRLRAVADQAGIAVGQVHAPMTAFPDTPEKREKYHDLALRGIEAAGALGSPYVVVHPLIWPGCVYDRGHAENKEMNLDFFSRLMPALRRCRVQLGIENMFAWDAERQSICPTVVSSAEEMADYIDTLNGLADEELFVACLDIGHATLTGLAPPEEMLRVLGSRTRLLHVQDTDGVSDLHTAPYFGGAVNWDAVCGALCAQRYSGTLSFEADGFLMRVPPSLYMDAERMLHAIGRRLADKVTG